MKLFYNFMQSLDIYLEDPMYKVFKTKELSDHNGGIYPCYYVEKEDHLLASRTVHDLIEKLGDIQLNPNFAPPQYFQKNFLMSNLKEVVYPYLSHIRGMTRLFSKIYTPEEMYPTWETVDKRIFKLKPFQKITKSQNTINFSPTYSLNKTQIINRTAEAMKEYIQTIEQRFPEKEHILLMGGRDSQLIGLVPKLNPKKWHIFTAGLNKNIVKRFLAKNKVEHRQCFFVKNKSDKSSNFLKRKILGTDLYADPRHQRWKQKLLSIQKGFSKDCIFWEGTAGASLFSYVNHFHDKPSLFFDKHLSYFGTFQASNHQATKFINHVPLLSPYHSKEFVNGIYQHHNPFLFKEGDDLRPFIGQKLKKGPIWFSQISPTPRPINYARFKNLDLLNLYVRTIIEKTNAYHNL